MDSRKERKKRKRENDRDRQRKWRAEKQLALVKNRLAVQLHRSGIKHAGTRGKYKIGIRNRTRWRLRYSGRATVVQRIGEQLKTNNTLKELDLGVNNIIDVQSIGEALKTNKTLTTLSLSKNNITDDSGIQSIIDGLKTNNTLRYLRLFNNQLSDKMKSQLKAIKQYKKDGSNGYQQVKRMEILA